MTAVLIAQNIVWWGVPILWIMAFIRGWFEEWKCWLFWAFYSGGQTLWDTFIDHRSVYTRAIDIAGTAFAIWMFTKTKPPKMRDKITDAIGAKSQALIDALTKKQAESGT